MIRPYVIRLKSRLRHIQTFHVVLDVKRMNKPHLICYTGEPNIIVSPSSPVSVTAGSKVILECAAAGDPPPSVQWIAPEDSGSKLQQVESRPGLFKLIIEDARPNDQGTYTCQARNLVGTARESVQLIGNLALYSLQRF